MRQVCSTDIIKELEDAKFWVLSALEDMCDEDAEQGRGAVCHACGVRVTSFRFHDYRIKEDTADWSCPECGHVHVVVNVSNFVDTADAKELYETNECGQCEFGEGNWRLGVLLTHEDDMDDYAREFAEDIGAVQDCAAWPCNNIDWKGAADDLKMDMACIDYEGATYYGQP